MKKTNFKNLFGLAMFFLLFGTQFFLGFFNILIIYALISELAVIFLLFFIKSTFYKESKMSFRIVLIITIILNIIDTTLRLLFSFKIPPTSPINPLEIPYYYLLVATVSIQLTISIFWLSYAELSMFKRIIKYNLEPWVKKRYLILGFSSAFFLLNGFILPLLPIEGAYEILPFTIIVAISIFVFSIGNLIGWVMPKKLKKYLNRNYVKTSDEVLSEKDLIDKINQQLKGGN
jgi:hypothetical protein